MLLIRKIFLATRECVAYTADIVLTIYISVVDLLSQLLFSYKTKNIDAQVMQVGTDRSFKVRQKRCVNSRAYKK